MGSEWKLAEACLTFLRKRTLHCRLRESVTHSMASPCLMGWLESKNQIPKLVQFSSEASPENAARERSRVRTLRQAFLALQAALPAVPPDTKLSKLDVLVLATSYIAHLTRTLGHELPSPAWPPFLRGLRHLHPLKKWPMRSRLYAGGLGCSDLDFTTAVASCQRIRDAEMGSQVAGEADVLLSTRPLSPALGNK
ncbi:Transcription factor 23 [Sciurus carolinensis]|uniref:Transcription factor 23 n=1 Tax=Sciurus carolinensis TaxID=30640 RepID=A0AA41T0K5_SCICA|nr:Transcription factor 23 [Sciurus carolinensis]